MTQMGTMGTGPDRRSSATSADSPGVMAMDYGPCEECRHERYRADGGHGCKLLEHGKPCTLARLIRQGGPWPAGCPRAESRMADVGTGMAEPQA